MPRKDKEGKGITQQELAEIKEVFGFFDKDDDGIVTAKEVGAVVRSIGHNPSEAEIQEMVDKLDPEGYGTVDFKDFLPLMTERIKEHSGDEDLMEAFQVFDKERCGFINTAELRNVMTSMGEKLTELEAEEMMKVADSAGAGKVDYEAFVSLMESG